MGLSNKNFIEVRGLWKRFADHWVIKNLSLSIDEGEIVVIQGASGVGKSTFLRCLTYLEPFDKGCVRVGPLALEAGMDENKHHQTILGVRQQLGFVFQNFNLFPHLTVLENLTIGPVRVLGQSNQKAKREAAALLKRVGLKHKADEYPKSLSGGQQQRVAIARALAMRPKGVLFDEPTSSLDPAMKGEIVEVMEDFAQDGLTMVIVTHEPDVVERVTTRAIEFGPNCSIIAEKTQPPIPALPLERPQELVQK
ncbi:MAG: amino acid ABC transporter ATP-binding protein [Elusimicrobia bacterium]|nr:amino acid ABC transporter ATP-binding protein [Elusimicrobiota bacterium]